MEREKIIEAMREKLLNAVGKYSDYSRYAMELESIENEYDETLELCNYAVWSGASSGTIQDKASHMLRITLDLFLDMRRNAQIELHSVLKEIMAVVEEEQKQIWKQEICLKPDQFQEEELEELLDSWDDFPYQQDEALESFEQFLAGALGEGDE